MEKDYKKIVCEYYGAVVQDDWADSMQHVQYLVLSTADGYNVYQRYTGESYILWDQDIYYYAEGMADQIKEDIENGSRIFLDPEIAEECGFEHDGWQWEQYYEKLVEEELTE